MLLVVLAPFYCYSVEPLQVGFAQTTVVVHEGMEAVLTITLNENAWITEPVTVTYSTVQDTASKLSLYYWSTIASLCGYTSVVSDDDYTSATDVPVTFALGEYSKDIRIATLVNGGVELVESFNVTLSTDCCAEIKNGLARVEIKEMGGNDTYLKLFKSLKVVLLCFSSLW